MTVGGGRPKVVRGRRRRKRHGTAFQGPPARRPGLSVEVTREVRMSSRAWKGGDGTHLDDDDDDDGKRVYGASLHSLRPDEGQACHSRPTPPSSSPTDTWCQVRIDRQQTASTNGRPLEAAGPAIMILTQQRRGAARVLPPRQPGGTPHVAREGCREERMSKDEKSLENLKIKDAMQ
ncbi:hypothetical protein H4582DRAFT_2065664 [Lactarius indigo]|nr:hypothetical protein H4582DRAFT_2065664 [Lactarius indigo]